ncbi:hypothetical protein BRARA_K00553 [Brassica rapa]|uniref:Zinc finger GRF-type domain-containing protein n=1 Tax=Brassica campestris TaxID=3711 RepID=A0A397KY42_BRACM|nr:hypothetical protein BRARA_K00553 [Brassica rapa]
MNFNGRGIPTHCRCGERVGLFTSKTVKNPGRLFHSCPHGDEVCEHYCLIMDTRACESVVTGLESVVTGLEKELRGLEKELQDSKMEVKGMKNIIVCVVVLVLFCKFVM